MTTEPVAVTIVTAVSGQLVSCVVVDVDRFRRRSTAAMHRFLESPLTAVHTRDAVAGSSSPVVGSVGEATSVSCSQPAIVLKYARELVYGFQNPEQLGWPRSMRLKDGKLVEVDLLQLAAKEEGKMFKDGPMLTYVQLVGSQRGALQGGASDPSSAVLCARA